MDISKRLTTNNDVHVHPKNKVWNAEKVAECIKLIEDGKDVPGGTPFHEGDPHWKASDVVYDYSETELQEIAKCAADVVYFANTYCEAMTDYGIQKITLRDYQVDVLRAFQDHRFNVFLAARQIGKTLGAQTLIKIFNKKTELSQTITWYQFFYSTIKKYRKLSFHEFLLKKLLDIQSKLTHGKIYKLEI